MSELLRGGRLLGVGALLGAGTLLGAGGLLVPAPAISLAEQILARTDLVGWWQADPAYVTASAGAIGAMANRKSGGAAFNQATAAAKPTLTGNALGGLSAASFDGGDFLACADALAVIQAAPVTIACLLKFSTSTGTQTVFSKRTDASNRLVLDIPANNAQVRAIVGSGSRAVSMAAGSWGLAVMASDGVSVGKIRANGADAADFTHNNLTSAATPAIGSQSSASASLPLAAGAQIRDLMIFSSFHPSAAGLLSLVERYFVQTYGLGFTPATS